MAIAKPESLIKTRVLKLVILLEVVMLLGLFTSISGVKATSRPHFCAICHEMLPEYNTWAASSHNQISCVSCHIRPGLANLVIYKVKSITVVKKHILQDYLLPITIIEPIPNDNCQSCHSLQRRMTPRGDINIPHDKHIKGRVTCVECHSGVAHGGIAERQLTIGGDFTKWNPDLARLEMNPKNTSINMRTCLTCHRDRGAKVRCEACHTEIVEPPSHDESDWLKTHGPLAIRDIKGCDRCHSYTRPAGLVPEQGKATEYARGNSFCVECHGKRPAGHTGRWKQDHSRTGPEAKQGCLTCHSNQMPGSYEPVVAKTYCSACHIQRHRNFNRANHPISLPMKAVIVPVCTQCHSTRTCGQCHYLEPQK